MNDRKQHWEEIYSENQPNEVSWYQTSPAISLDLINQVRPLSNGSIIDVGGGASILVDRLLETGFERIAVLDISSEALN